MTGLDQEQEEQELDVVSSTGVTLQCRFNPSHSQKTSTLYWIRCCIIIIVIINMIIINIIFRIIITSYSCSWSLSWLSLSKSKFFLSSLSYFYRSNRRKHDNVAIGLTAFHQDYRGNIQEIQCFHIFISWFFFLCVDIFLCVDCSKGTDQNLFINPLYNNC